MKQYLLLFGLLGCLVFAGSVMAQETDGGFDSMIDSVVQDAFSRFDEKYNTYIFTEEPSALSESDEDYDWSYDNNRWRRLDRNGSRLYSGSVGSRLNLTSSQALPWEFMNENLLFRYNRVEALFLGIGFPNRYSWDHRSISLFGSGGWGTSSHRWRYNGGVAQQFGMGKTMIEAGVEAHSLTDTKDRWLNDEGENTVAALFVRDDNRDYFGREGMSAWLGVYGKWRNSDMQVKVSYLNDQYESLDWRTNWSIFGGGDKSFRNNPAINEGRMRSILASFEMHEEHQRSYFTAGWKAAVSAEIAGKSFGGDFGFNKYQVDVTRYQPLSRYENLNVRLHVGSTTGDAPVQKWFELGGISTLPAFSYKEFQGNRVALVNAEYLLNGKILDNVDIFPSWLLRNTNFILFYDAGFTNAVSGESKFNEGFSSATLQTLKTDWGFGIGSRDAKIRLGFAWRTDIAEPVHVFLRLSRPF